MVIGRNKIAKAAAEVADHLRLVENVHALQIAQKELADEVRAINARLADLAADLRALKAEAKFECLRETQLIVNAVQGSFNERLEAISNKLAVLDSAVEMPARRSLPPGERGDPS